MNTQAHARRLARLSKEADQSAGPALVLLLASVVLALALGLAALLGPPADAQAEAPDLQASAPAA